MRTLITAASFIAMLGAFAAPALAQNTASDVRCLLVSNVFANSEKNPKAKQVASAASLFYSGRVSALPDATIHSSLEAEAKQLTVANAAPTMTACAQRMTRALQQLQPSEGKVQQEKR